MVDPVFSGYKCNCYIYLLSIIRKQQLLRENHKEFELKFKISNLSCPDIHRGIPLGRKFTNKIQDKVLQRGSNTSYVFKKPRILGYITPFGIRGLPKAPVDASSGTKPLASSSNGISLIPLPTPPPSTHTGCACKAPTSSS